MKFITTTDSLSGEEIKLAYSDYGSGRPVVLIHGWPLSREMWEYQLQDLVDAGFRVIKYDRRGFGQSSKPWDGYDYDSLAGDLNTLMEQLDLHDATIVGFSMGGGEAVRYLSLYGAKRVNRIALISAVTPYLAKTDSNPDGVDQSVFKEIMEQMKNDRISFLDSFGKQFFGVNLISHPVSAPLLEYYRMLASLASGRATQQCALSFAQTDFRDDVSAVDIPVLIIHGDSDKTVPIEASGARTASMIPNAEYKVYEGAPHGLFYTHRGQLNRDLIQFISGALPVEHTKIGEQAGLI
jgi:non-heme chloroperoxidase